MNEVVYARLLEKARSKGLVFYQEVGSLVGLDMGSPDDRNRIADILDEIERCEDAEGRPMISALVVRADTDVPGAGFFKCARELGKLSGPDKEESRLAFWCDEVKRVYGYWAGR